MNHKRRQYFGKLLLGLKVDRTAEDLPHESTYGSGVTGYMVDQVVRQELPGRWPLLKVLEQTQADEVVEAFGP